MVLDQESVYQPFMFNIYVCDSMTTHTQQSLFVHYLAINGAHLLGRVHGQNQKPQTTGFRGNLFNKIQLNNSQTYLSPWLYSEPAVTSAIFHVTFEGTKL